MAARKDGRHAAASAAEVFSSFPSAGGCKSRPPHSGYKPRRMAGAAYRTSGSAGIAGAQQVRLSMRPYFDKMNAEELYAISMQWMQDRQNAAL